MRMPTGLDSPSIDVAYAQRHIGAFERASESVQQTVRELLGSTDAAFSFGSRALRPSTGAQGDRFFATDYQTLYVYNGTAWEVVVGFNSGTNATRAAITPDATDNGMFFWTTDTGKLWEVAGGIWVDRFTSVDVTTSYKVGGVKVLGAQGAAIADASGGATVDTEARAAINALLARMRTHGTIAT